jgi:hypothetical protein
MNEMSRSRSHSSSRLLLGGMVLALTILWSCSAAWAAAPRHRPVPSRSTTLAVQTLFHELGYPLAREARGHYGTQTKGAVEYFQHKYRLPITGYPNARTASEMRAVAFSLLSRPGGNQPPPRDLVNRLVGHLPILPLGVGVALVLCVLALAGPRARSLTDGG